MQNTPRRDTPFEIAVRKRTHALGLRFRVDHRLPGVTRARPDLVFPGRRVAVFLDGCFWHSCPEHRSTPRTNRDWWIAKLGANVERDERHRSELEAAGWTVLRFWEHEDPAAVAADIEAAVRRAGNGARRTRNPAHRSPAAAKPGTRLDRAPPLPR